MDTLTLYHCWIYTRNIGYVVDIFPWPKLSPENFATYPKLWKCPDTFINLRHFANVLQVDTICRLAEVFCGWYLSQHLRTYFSLTPGQNVDLEMVVHLNTFRQFSPMRGFLRMIFVSTPTHLLFFDTWTKRWPGNGRSSQHLQTIFTYALTY